MRWLILLMWNNSEILQLQFKLFSMICVTQFHQHVTLNTPINGPENNFRIETKSYEIWEQKLHSGKSSFKNNRRSGTALTPTHINTTQNV